MNKSNDKTLREKTTPENTDERNDSSKKIGETNPALANGKDPSSSPKPQDTLVDGDQAKTNAKHPLDYDKNKSAKPS